MDNTVSLTVRDIEQAIAEAFPPERAESWDRVGLTVGDPASRVTGVACALDATHEAIAFALDNDANVLVTHHPAFLEPPRTFVAGRGPAGIIHAAARAGISLINAHTNLDRHARAQELMPEALGLIPITGLERSLLPLALVSVYVPNAHISAVADGMSAVGAGRVGDYVDCAFSAPGRGAYLSPSDARPCVGSPGEPASVDETRLEMVCPLDSASRVVAAAVAVHPYEEPLVTSTPVSISRNRWRLGRICSAPEGLTVSALSEVAAEVYGVPPRVWGDPDALLELVATTTGSGGSLIPDALAAGAQAFVMGEVRYHDAVEAAAAGLALVEVGHDVSEWPLVGLLEEAVLRAEGLDSSLVHTMSAHAGWWIPNERTRG